MSQKTPEAANPFGATIEPGTSVNLRFMVQAVIRGGSQEFDVKFNGTAPEFGKDAFHRVPQTVSKEWDAVERVTTNMGCAAGLCRAAFRVNRIITKVNQWV